MSNHFNLIYSLALNNFNAKLYSYQDYTDPIVSQETLDQKMNILNNQETPIELSQLLISLDGIKRVTVLDKSDSLLLEISEDL